MDIDKFIQENMFVIEHPNGDSESVISTDDVREFVSAQLSSMPPSADVLVEALRFISAGNCATLQGSILHASSTLSDYEAKLLPKE
jgi:hypothetical protein